MTGTTPAYGFPYPDPADRARAGSVAIRALAEAVEGWWPKGEGAVVAYGDSPTTFAANTAVPVTFPGAVALMSGFTFDGVTLARVGPPRNFMVVVEAYVEVNGGSGVSAISSSLSLASNVGAFAGSYDQLAHGAPTNTIVQRGIAHSLSSVVRLGTGDVVHVEASGSHAGVVGSCTLRAFPIGPVE